MIIPKILENDLHRSRKGDDVMPHMIEVPAREDFVPAVISNTRGKFIISRKIVSGADGGRIRVGMFDQDPAKLDDILSDMLDAALDLARTEGWQNVFDKDDSASAAFKYVRKHSHMTGQPHTCLVPDAWETDRILAWLKRRKWESVMKYRKCCRVVTCGVRTPVFCSRPDFVGMYTHFMGGPSGFLLHNVRRGLAFCDVGR